MSSPNVSILTNFTTPWDNQMKSTNLSAKDIPKGFFWSHGDDYNQPKPKLDAPVIDLQGFINGDPVATEKAARLLREVGSTHGFFQVINHGIDQKIIQEAYDNIDTYFKLPPAEKAKTLRQPSKPWGLSVAHADRYVKTLPWKETFSFPHLSKTSGCESVVDYFTSILGSEFESMGMVYQKYSDEMHRLTQVLAELLAISLGVDRSYYRDFYEDSKSIMRVNYYPPCDEPHIVQGTGPHCDPTSLTVLYQDQVGGLEVLFDNKWQAVEPCADALVINIGDTFQAITNGEFKSCLHRALVNDKMERKSMVYFLNPREDKVVRPPPGLDNPRKYPDFTWSQFFTFTQTHYRVNESTLECFINWLSSGSPQDSETKST